MGAPGVAVDMGGEQRGGVAQMGLIGLMGLI
jgi:hypothetical protein